MTTVRDETLYGMWDDRIRLEGDPKKLAFQSDWDQGDDFLMNNVRLSRPPGTEWMRGDLMSDAFELIDSHIPALAANSIRDPRSFTVESVTAPSVVYQYAAQEKLASDRRAARLATTIPAHLRTGLARGHMIHYSFWLRELGERRLPMMSNPALGPDGDSAMRPAEISKVITHDGPWTEFGDLRRTWFSNTKDALGNYLWVVQEFEADLDYLRYMDSEYRAHAGHELYAGLRNLSTSTFAFSGSGAVNPAATFGPPRPHTAGVGTQSSTSRTSGLSDQSLSPKNAVTLRQCWGWVPSRADGGRNYTDTQWRYQVFALDGTKLRDEALPTPNLRPPHRDVAFVQIGDEPYGRSALRWVLGEIQTASELRNLRLAEAWINILRPRIARRDVGWSFRSLGLAPGVVYTYDSDDAPGDVMGMLPVSQVMPQAFAEVEEARSRARQTFGSDLNRLGESHGQRTSAFEISQIEQKSGSRVRLQSMLVGVQLDQRIMEDYFLLNQTYLSRPAWIKLAEEHGGGRPVTLTADQLIWPVDIYVKAGDFGSIDGQQAQNYLTLLTAFAQDPEAREWLRVPEMAEDFLYRSGTLNPRRFFRSQQEVENARAQRAALAVQTQAALATAEMGPGGDGAGEGDGGESAGRSKGRSE